MKPTDERLQELIKSSTLDILDGKDFITDNVSEIYSIFTELLASRQTIKRLVEDGERMALILSDGEGKEDEICCVDYFYARDAVYRHTALMSEIGEQK